MPSEMNPIEKRLVEATHAFAARQTHFMSDQDAEAFARAILAFRGELDMAAHGGVEHWEAWHMVSPWLADPQDKLYCLGRVLAMLPAGHSADLPDRDRIISTHNFLRAQCLVQM